MCVRTCQNRCTLQWLLLFSPHSLRGPNRALLCLSGHWKFPQRLYSEFHFLPFWFILFFSPFSFIFFAVKYLFVPCLNFIEELIFKWRLGSDKMDEMNYLRRGKTLKNNAMQWLKVSKKQGLLLSRLWRGVGCLHKCKMEFTLPNVTWNDLNVQSMSPGI